MSELFNNKMKTALQTVYNLELANELDMAKKMYVRIIKSVADYNKVDVLTYFYGSGIYESVAKFDDAILYVFIAKCARNAYAAIEPLGSAVGSGNPWAVDSDDECDEEFLEVLRWLNEKGRAVEEDDSKMFKILIKMSRDKNKKSFQLAEKLKKMKLIEIIPLIVNGNRTVTEDGEIR
jgi:hypothetical protein